MPPRTIARLLRPEVTPRSVAGSYVAGLVIIVAGLFVQPESKTLQVLLEAWIVPFFLFAMPVIIAAWWLIITRTLRAIGRRLVAKKGAGSPLLEISAARDLWDADLDDSTRLAR